MHLKRQHRAEAEEMDREAAGKELEHRAHMEDNYKVIAGLEEKLASS